jgi:hypothetical protein
VLLASWSSHAFLVGESHLARCFAFAHRLLIGSSGRPPSGLGAWIVLPFPSSWQIVSDILRCDLVILTSQKNMWF